MPLGRHPRARLLGNMRVFFSGIGGVGIGPLALIARDMGHDVIGSDANPSRYTELMAKRGIEVAYDQSGQALKTALTDKPLDWYVYTAAMPEDHPELAMAHQLGIRTGKRDKLLNHLIQDKGLRLIAASGTDGKTTTTGMLIWLFKELGLPISYSIGTNINFGASGQYQEGSQYFIYEGDEYDRNFLHFSPLASVIANIGYDHSDTYPSRSDYLDAFRQFISQSHCTFIWSKDAEKIGGLPDGVVHTYGADEDLSRIELPGHNQRNAFLAVQCVHSLFPETSLEELFSIINRFPGTERRFEKLADNLYTDYAHLPAEIESTIAMAREVNKNVIAVYQPHQNLRQHELYKSKDYLHTFDQARRVYWLPTYLSREPADLAVLSPEELIKDLSGQDKFTVSGLDDGLKKVIKGHLADGDLILLMGAGDIDAWARKNL